MLAVKFLLTLAFTFKTSLGTGLLTGGCVLSGVAWYFLVVMYLPYHQHRMNAVEAAMGAVQTWVSGSSLLRRVRRRLFNAFRLRFPATRLAYA